MPTQERDRENACELRLTFRSFSSSAPGIRYHSEGRDSTVPQHLRQALQPGTCAATAMGRVLFSLLPKLASSDSFFGPSFHSPPRGAQTVQGIKQNTLEEMEVICSEAGLWRKLESLDALSKECGISASQKTLEALR